MKRFLLVMGLAVGVAMPFGGSILSAVSPTAAYAGQNGQRGANTAHGQNVADEDVDADESTPQAADPDDNEEDEEGTNGNN